MYSTLKTIHIFTVVLSIVLFLVRLTWSYQSPARLQLMWVRVLPHVIDTLLLGSAIGLTMAIHQYPFVNSWLTAKLVALVSYIVFGSYALKRARTRGGQIGATVCALVSVIYIVVVAV